MVVNKAEKIYCSLDIETSDFDPSTGEILELGMIFFNIEQGKFKILREWTSTFKAVKPVPPRILALTGIDPEELKNSGSFQEKHREIQELVENAVIVGHNINFDIGFLQGYGIKFSGDHVDTLELAQLFLPTAVSYNLESLMNLLKVEHKEAHRALADARAALIVFDKLLRHYAAFPEELQRRLQQLFSDKTEIGALLRIKFEPKQLLVAAQRFPILHSDEIDLSLKEQDAIISFPLGFDYYHYLYGALSKTKEKLVLVVPNRKILYDLWKNKLVFPIFENQDLFNEKQFEKNLKKKLRPEQKLFLGKVLVWKYTNWQVESLVDLNWSFGNQFREMVSYNQDLEAVTLPESKEKIIAIDYFNFIKSDFGAKLKNRKLLILDINNFENALTYVSGKRISWGDFIFHLRQIYDPETQIGKTEVAADIQSALAQTDLFFGLASLNFKKIHNQSQNILVDHAVSHRSEYAAIAAAAEGFCSKTEQLNKKIKSERITKLISDLRTFFVEDPKLVRWVELSENRLTFFASPIDLHEIAEKKLRPFKKTLFTASLGSESLIKYFTGRLNLQDFKTKIIGQQELSKKCQVIIRPDGLDPKKLLDLAQNLDFPAALLLPSGLALREFYESNFKKLQSRYKVFVQGYTGGTTKLLENFSIAENSLFIATDRFVLKQIGKKLKVKTLVLSLLPFEQFNHPLFAAQAEKYQNQFLDFNIPRALYNFHTLIRFFYSQDLEKIYILDQKITKDYGKYFVDYLKSLPFVELLT